MSLLLLACAAPVEEAAQQARDEEPVARVYRHIGGDPVEVFQAEDGDQVLYDPVGRELLLDPPIAVKKRWALAKPLGACIGDPLSLPPAGDVGGFRKLRLEGREGHWLIELSGRNHCKLSGLVILDVQYPQADVRGLEAHGLPWGEGGREAVLEQLRGELMALAAETWDTMNEEEKLAVWRSLSTTEEGRAFVESLADSLAPAHEADGQHRQEP
ncbi:MAG TPA: hypothetical protein QGF58_04960 [Myxococcota bacterium]|nr:hypothetical protein [Myxococcota bacterium]